MRHFLAFLFAPTLLVLTSLCACGTPQQQPLAAPKKAVELTDTAIKVEVPIDDKLPQGAAALLGSRMWRIKNSARAQVTADGVMVFANNRIVQIDTTTGQEQDLGEASSNALVSGNGRVLIDPVSDYRIVPGNAAAGMVQVHELALRHLGTKKQRTIPLPAEPNALTTSYNGRWIAAHFRSPHNKLLLFDANELAKTHLVADALNDVKQLKLSPDGTHIAWTTSKTGEVIFTGVESPAPQTLAFHQETVEALAFNHDSTKLYTGDHGGLVVRWDLAYPQSPAMSIKPPQKYDPFMRYLKALEVSPDGSMLLIAGGDGAVTVLHHQPVISGERAIEPLGQIKPLHQNAPKGSLLRTRSIGFTPDSKRLVQVTNDGVIRVTETQTWTEVSGTPGQHSTQLSGVALSHDGLRAATIDNAGQAMVWDTTNAALLATLDHPTDLEAVAFHPKDHDQLLTADSRGALRLWSVSNAAIKAAYFEHWAIPQEVAWSPSGDRIASVDSDGGLCIWDVGGRLLVRQPFYETLRALDWSPDGTKLALGGEHGEFSIVDPDTGKMLVRHVRQPVDDDDFIDTTTAVSWSPDGSMLLTRQDEIVVWNTQTWTERWAMLPDSLFTGIPAWSADGKHVAFTDSSQHIWWLDAATGQKASRLYCGEKCGRMLAVGPGPTIVLDNLDSTATLWRGSIKTRPPDEDHPAPDPVEVQAKTTPIPNPAPPCAGEAATDLLGDALPPCAVQRLGTRRFHANDDITDLIWSPDGTSLVGISSEESHQAFEWNTADGRPMGTLEIDDDTTGFTGAIFTSNGHLVTRAGSRIHGWNLDWHQPSWSAPDWRQGAPTLLALPKYGDAFVTGWESHQLAIVDATTGQPKDIIQSPAKDAKPLLHNADRLFVSQKTSGDHPPLMVYNTQTRAWATLPWGPFDDDDRQSLQALYIEALALTSKGDFLAIAWETFWVGDEHVMKRITPTAANGQPLTDTQGDDVSAWKHFELSPDGQRLIALDDDGRAFLMDMSFKVIRQIGKRRVSAVAFSPDGTKLAVASDATVILYNPTTGAQISPVAQGAPGWLRGVVGLSGDLIVTHAYNSWHLWNHSKPELLHDLPMDSGIGEQIIHHGPDKTLFSKATLVDSGTLINTYNAAKPSSKPQRQTTLKGVYLSPIAQSADGQTVAMYGDEDIFIYNTRKRTLGQKIPLGGYTQNAALSPDGSLLAVLVGGALYVYNRQGKLIKKDSDHISAFSGHPVWRNNTELLFLGDDGIELRAYPSLSKTADLHTPRLAQPVAISRDGRWLVGADHDGNVFLWDLNDRALVMAVKGHEDIVSDIEFLSDGKHFVTASHDGTALVWRLPQSP